MKLYGKQVGSRWLMLSKDDMEHMRHLEGIIRINGKYQVGEDSRLAIDCSALHRQVSKAFGGGGKALPATRELV